MDDSCAVCAEPMEWTAYGPCGHRDLCSTCVVRLRVVLQDRRCCICKSECPFVFVTKAMGDYTHMIKEFSMFPENPREGRVGQYWFHEDAEAFFDDAEHYKMIRAMCKLSCSICDKSSDEQGVGPGAERRNRFTRIDQLKGHLFRQHKLCMCNLCLEGRKVFICEQKLYTKTQLNQHIRSGDSEVDGSEIERNGFSGHPSCEFCKTHFYGDNELYGHMSQVHYTCHLCQRQHPGQYDYYNNYDDLEVHFRQDHFLCEDETCLSEKWVVFATEAELKRHNVIKHAGRMSRAKRNVALQIPISFRYQRSEQEPRRRGAGRQRGFNPSFEARDTNMHVVASSFETLGIGADSGPPFISEHNQTPKTTLNLGESSFPSLSEQEPVRPSLERDLDQSSFPPLSSREQSEITSRYARALVSNPTSVSVLGEESFPPLPGGSIRSNVTVQQGLPSSSARNTFASQIMQRKKGKGKALHSSFPGPTEVQERSLASASGTLQVWPALDHGASSASSLQPLTSERSTRENGTSGPLSTKFASTLISAGGTRNSNLIPSSSNPAASSTPQAPMPNVEAVQTANKTLVEKIRVSLGMDDDRYLAFKSISGEYRQGLMNSREYLSCVDQFGLLHLIPELASLLPDDHKQKELLEAYSSHLNLKGLQENGIDAKLSKRKKKGKGKTVDLAETSSSKDVRTESFLDAVRKLQANQSMQDEDEVLSKEGYRTAKSNISIPEPNDMAHSNSSSVGSSSSSNSISTQLLKANSSADQNAGAEGSSNKHRKKMQKFLRTRLGEGYTASPDPNVNTENSPERPPVRGAWQNSASRLFS